MLSSQAEEIIRWEEQVATEEEFGALGSNSEENDSIQESGCIRKVGLLNRAAPLRKVETLNRLAIFKRVATLKRVAAFRTGVTKESDGAKIA
jgi:hypothetical protein